MTVQNTITKEDKIPGRQNVLSNGFKFGLNEYKSHRKIIHQTSILFFSQIFGLLIGLVIKIIQTRALGPSDYGLFAFFLSVTGFSVLFFRFGLFSSIKVLLAGNSDPKKERELFGTGFLIAFLVGLSFSLFIFASSFFIDDLFKVNLGVTLRLVSPLCFVLPFQYFIPALSVGSNKIRHLSIYNILSKLLFVAPLTVMFFYDSLTVFAVIFINLGSIIIAVVYILIRFKPLFSNNKKILKDILEKNKTYGLHLYAGQIADQATFKLDGLMIAYFVNITQLGFYTLTIVLCYTMVIFSRALSESLFRRFAQKGTLSKKVIIYNFLWLIAFVIGLNIMGKQVVSLLLGKNYLPMVKYILPISIAVFFQGMYQPYGLFFESKGKGKWVRNNSFITSFINITGNFLLIPVWGVYGAAIASIMSKITHYSVYIFYMRKFKNE